MFEMLKFMLVKKRKEKEEKNISIIHVCNWQKLKSYKF